VVPADTTTRRVRIYASHHESYAQVTATLSDGSAAAFTANATQYGGDVTAIIDIVYAAASANQTLSVKWVATNELSVHSNVAVTAVTLAKVEPEIDVRGNNTSIVRGDGTPSSTDHTDFGSVNVGASFARTFTIANSGVGALALTGTPVVAISGPHAADFAVTTAPATTVNAGSNTPFQITFTPTAAGLRTATVTLANNDSNENPYTFAIAGSGFGVPALHIPSSTVNVIDTKFSVPVIFTANGKNIASVAFSLDYDENCLLFDPTDTDGDGIPDAIVGLPGAFAPNFSYDSSDTDGEVDLVLLDDTEPISSLSSGTLFTIQFTVKLACQQPVNGSTNVVINFSNAPAATFGDPLAVDVSGTATGATVPLNFPATAIALSNTRVNEASVVGTTVGAFSSTDPNAGDNHTYALVAGEGDSDNASFTIAGNTLKTAAVFDFETKSSYTIRVRATDTGGLTYEQNFTISVNNLPEAPTGILYSDGQASDGNPATLDVNENVAAGATVATLSPANPDSLNSYNYQLVAGAGDTDNGSFTIAGNALKANSAFNYEVKSSYSVRLRITDGGGNTFEQSFTVVVNNLNEAPAAVNDTPNPRTTIFLGGQAAVIDVLANDSDEDGNPLTIGSLDTTGAQGDVTSEGANISYTAPNANGSTTFLYQATDGALLSSPAAVNVSYVANNTRGDCNGNGGVAASDFIATVLEIFDANNLKYENQPAWWLTYTGDYAGSPLGCDANNSRNGVNNSSASITAADITCTVLLFFGHTCGTGVQAAAADQAATLSVVTIANGEQTTIPVTLKSNGQAIAAVAFALNLGDAPFDASDANGDGLPDAVALNVPTGVMKSVTWNAQARRLEVALYGATLPLPTLSDGVLATVTVDGVVTPSLSQVSLSDANGNDLLAPRMSAFLPLVTR